MHGRRLSCIDPEVKISKVKVSRLVTACCGWGGLKVDRTAGVFIVERIDLPLS